MSSTTMVIRRRPIWRRLAGKVLKHALSWRFRNFDAETQGGRYVRVGKLRLWVEPGVFDPSLHFTSAALSRYLLSAGDLYRAASILDVGTGSGVAALSAARAGVGNVIAIDINPSAVQSAQRNIAAAGLLSRVSVQLGDMFEPVDGAKFDLVICNPPYFRGSPSTPAEAAYMAGQNLEWIERFASELQAHLHPGGRGLVVLGDAADVRSILARFAAHGFSVRKVARRDILVEVVYVFALVPASH